MLPLTAMASSGPEGPATDPTRQPRRGSIPNEEGLRALGSMIEGSSGPGKSPGSNPEPPPVGTIGSDPDAPPNGTEPAGAGAAGANGALPPTPTGRPPRPRLTGPTRR